MEQKTNRRVIFKVPMPKISIAVKIKEYVTRTSNVLKTAAQLEKEIKELYGFEVTVLK